MEDNKQERAEIPKNNLNPAVIESKISLDLTKAEGNYHQVLKQVLEYDVNEDNFEDAQALNKRVMKFLTFVEDHRSDEKKPYLDAGRSIDAAHKKFATPFEEAKSQLQAKINVVGKRKEDAAKKALQEQQRIEAFKTFINSFI